jgi:hypothetical protein
MFDREAPRVFITYAHDSPEHKTMVLQFAEFLRAHIGLDVHLDSWYDNRRRDWSAWAVEQWTKADYFLVVASPAYRRRADGTAPADEGRGSQFEAAMLRDNLTKDLHRETERVLPVVLPGMSVEDIPTFLNAHSTTRFHVDAFTEAGVAELVAAITGEGRYPMPERGRWNGGVTGSPTAGPTVVMAGGRDWLTNSSNVRVGGARIGGVYYDESIVLRPASLTTDARGFVEVDLDRRYSRLTTVAGVLDDATEPFQVGHFRIYLDGSPQPECRAALGKPAAVDLDVTGARRLRLEMYREAAPLHPGATTGPSRRLPELAWGNPTLR